jgi:GPH family glycoside/pentoside/hexuronide:cation symporter
VSRFFADDFVEGAVATALAGVGLAGLLMLPIVLLSDIIDEDETVTAARREGMFFGINGLVIRLAFTMQGLTTGLVLALTGYVSSTPGTLYPVQPAAAVFGIRALTAGVPLLASLVVFWALQRYPLHGDRLAGMRAAVAARRRVRAAGAQT